MSGGRRTIGEIPASEIPSLCRPLAAAVCRLVVIVVVGVRLAAAGDVSIDASRQGQFPIAVVTVVVEDRAHVPAWILDHAEKEASRIYRRAGVTTVWRETAAAVNGFTVELIIMPALTAPRMGRARFVLGATTETRECGGSSYVFYDQVTGLSIDERIEPAVVLGSAVAHEIGHLVLRRPGHSAEGLMRGPWNLRDWQQASLGWLLFSSRDAETIHAAICSC
jgi:hypothetical protein